MKRLPLILLAASLTLAAAPATAAPSPEEQAKSWAAMFSQLDAKKHCFVVVGFEDTSHVINKVVKIEASGPYLVLTWWRGSTGDQFTAIVKAENVMVISEGP